MNRYNGKPLPPRRQEDDDELRGQERRRIGQIVHDDRGSASVEWKDAPDDYDRPVFELEDTHSGRADAKLRMGFNPTLEIKNDDTFNPYDRKPTTFGNAPPAPKGGKRDLKKLSEWMKLMRAIEERKKNGGDND